MYKTDYEKSRQREIEFESFIKTKYKGLLTENSESKGLFSSWDISTTATNHDNKITTFEVKYNSIYPKGTFGSHNTLCIEDGKIIDGYEHPSGINISQSNYYCLTFESEPNTFFIIPTHKLKELIEDSSIPKKTVYSNGYRIQVLPKDLILAHSKKL